MLDDADKINLSDMRIMMEEESSKRVFHCNVVKCMYWNRFRCQLHEVEINKDGVCSRRWIALADAAADRSKAEKDERNKGENE
jgi:hypothetical protein